MIILVSCLLYADMKRGVAPAATRDITDMRCTASSLDGPDD